MEGSKNERKETLDKQDEIMKRVEEIHMEQWKKHAAREEEAYDNQEFGEQNADDDPDRESEDEGQVRPIAVRQRRTAAELKMAQEPPEIRSDPWDPNKRILYDADAALEAMEKPRLKKIEFSEAYKKEAKATAMMNYRITHHMDKALKDPPDMKEGQKMAVHMKHKQKGATTSVLTAIRYNLMMELTEKYGVINDESLQGKIWKDQDTKEESKDQKSGTSGL